MITMSSRSFLLIRLDNVSVNNLNSFSRQIAFSTRIYILRIYRVYRVYRASGAHFAFPINPWLARFACTVIYVAFVALRKAVTKVESSKKKSHYKQSELIPSIFFMHDNRGNDEEWKRKQQQTINLPKVLTIFTDYKYTT